MHAGKMGNLLAAEAGEYKIEPIQESQKFMLKHNGLRYSIPSSNYNFIIAGPTFSGKTTFVKRLIRKRMIQPPPQRIIWIYKEQDDKAELEAMASEFPTIQFHSDIDNSIFDSINPTERNWVILDDVMS